MDVINPDIPPIRMDGRTNFKTRWRAFAESRRLTDVEIDPYAPVTLTVAELRSAAMEFFSWGLVHHAFMLHRCDLLRLLEPQANEKPPEPLSGGALR